VAADAANIARARGFVSALEARGGTEMVPAMVAALKDTGGEDTGYLRQVVFLTDGAIGNEQQLFDAITQSRGRSRIFMVGIGSAPNTYLMTRAAELGRGTFTHIGSASQVEERMRALFERLESPAVTGLSARLSAGGADVTPSALPDLYRGEPLVVAARLGKLDGTLVVEGRIGDQPWQASLALAGAAEGKGLSKLWARRKITDAEVGATLREIERQEADRRILELALAHGLVTRLTSLVAVDATPSRPEGVALTRADIPLNLPAGWDFDKVFGTERRDPRTRADASGAKLERTGLAVGGEWAKAVATRAAPAAVAAGPQLQPVVLPQGATDAELRMTIGAALLMLSLLVMWRTRSRSA
jgi:Ca-activated chloride channel family protein